MIKKIILLSLMIPILFLLTGCWNYNELNTLAIATGLAIDKDKNGYEVSLLIANSKKAEESSKEGESQTIVYSGKGKTISQAMKDIDLVSPKQLYIGHLSVIILSEDIAKNGIIDVLDFLLREPESFKRFYVALAKENKAKDVLKILSPLESFPSQNIYSNIKYSGESHAISSAVPYSFFVEELLAKGKNPILPSIIIEGDVKKGSKSDSLKESTPQALIKLDTLGIFKRDKLLGYANSNESRGINLIKGNVDEMVLETTCKEGNAIAKLSNIKTSKKIDKKKMKISISGTGYIREMNCTNNLNNPKEIETIEKDFEKELKKIVKEGINVSRKYKSDVLGFGNLLYKKDPSYFNSIKDIWNENVFLTYPYTIDINLKLEAKGSIETGLKGALHA